MSKIVDLITQDHRKVETLFGNYETINNELQKEEIGRHILHELKVHAEAEETYVYPFMDQRDPEAEELEEHAQHEHEEIRAAIAEVEQAEEKAQAMAKLKAVVEHHVKDEEDEFLPALDERVGETGDEEMVSSWEMFKASRPIS